jgi:hypothetical protein
MIIGQEFVHRINNAKNETELDGTISEIRLMSKEERQRVLGESPAPEPEIRRLGQYSVGDNPGKVGSPSGNWFYVLSKFMK